MLLERIPVAGVLLALLVIPTATLAPQGDQGDDDVMAVVERLFDGMREADSASVARLFHPAARLVSIDWREGRQETRVMSAEDFAAAVGMSERQWEERIWDPEVRIDGGLATVWANYDFRVAGRRTHCGVDVFHLTRTAEGWKIISIIYSRRTQECEGPPGG